MSSGRFVETLNMTNFFTRELMMYSLGDIKLKKPIGLKKVAYVTIFLIVWTIPLVLIFGLQLNIYFAVIAIVPPIALGHFASKPVWGGKGLIDFIKTLVSYVFQPKTWTDLNPTKRSKEKYYIQSEIWISRRRELQLLADMREKRMKEHEELQGA